MQQFRLEATIAFHCFRCGQDKKSRLITIYDSDWNKCLCNGCYGRLLSIYDIKAGTSSEDVKAEALAELLLGLATAAQSGQVAHRIRIADQRAALLSEKGMLFLSTSDYVASGLQDNPSLDWSAAIIGLCKAFETELVFRVFEPLRILAEGTDLTQDARDRDLQRVANYCAKKTPAAPELGAVGYFLQTASHSRERIESSYLLQLFKKQLSEWPRSSWLLEPDGAAAAIATLARDFRNRAAHTDDLARDDYEACRDFVAGSDGILWSLIYATEGRKR